MKTQEILRWSLPAGFVLAVAALALMVWSYGYRQALDSLAERSAADLALASDRVSSELQIYQEMVVLTVDHPVLRGLAAQPSEVAVQRTAVAFLRSVADKTGALDVFFADTQGRVLAAAAGLSGGNVAGQSYFERAMQGALGTGHAVLQPEGQRAYFYAAPAFGAMGRVQGALVVVVDVVDVEQTWRGSMPAVFFTGKNGEVFISNRLELRFWEQQETKLRVVERRLHAGHEIWQLEGSAYLPRQALHMAVELPLIGMTGEILVDVAPARRIATLQAATLAALCLAFGAMLFFVMERRRTLAQANLVLESRVQQRTRDLSAANAQLRREVREREEAEAALKRAQQDLVQAGKLSALGQMSAGISHELNQPLMAIQQYAENGAAFLARGKAERTGENLGRIADMATRMARIIKNLRAFARNESEPVGRVDLAKVLEDAVELTQVRLRECSVRLNWVPQPRGLLVVRGGEVRLTQVFVNLINNAVDAMLDQSERVIHLEVEQGAARLVVLVRDIGPGLKEPEKVFDPFYSTKAVGSSEGMGLGLSISYGLVQSFGGNIRGSNAAEGALFTVELDYWKEEDAA